MCKSLTKAFSGKAERLAEMEAKVAQDAATDALKKAATPVGDSEDTRKASDALLKRRLAQRGVGSTIGAGGMESAAPQLGLKMLMGQ